MNVIPLAVERLKDIGTHKCAMAYIVWFASIWTMPFCRWAHARACSFLCCSWDFVLAAELRKGVHTRCVFISAMLNSKLICGRIIERFEDSQQDTHKKNGIRCESVCLLFTIFLPYVGEITFIHAFAFHRISLRLVCSSIDYWQRSCLFMRDF